LLHIHNNFQYAGCTTEIYMLSIIANYISISWLLVTIGNPYYGKCVVDNNNNADDYDNYNNNTYIAL
jgi:hypothetical protein